MHHLNQHHENMSIGPSVSAALLAGRVLMAVAFLSLALGQIRFYEEALEVVDSLGMPWPGVYCALALLCGFCGSLMLGLGLWARAGAAAIIAVLLPLAVVFIPGGSNKIFLAGIIALIGGLLPYIVCGPGKFVFKPYGKKKHARLSGISRGR